MNKSQKFIIIAIILIVSMGTLYTLLWNEVEVYVNPEKEISETLDGERKQYYSDGRLRTIVNYDQGIKHGLSTLFHQDGKTVMLTIPYEQGKRQGTSKKYFETGKIYAETNYVDDKLHGQRKVYYRSGKVKSIVNYHKGFPGVGTVEYTTSGKKKPSIEISQEVVGSTIQFSTSSWCDNARFFIGSLIDGAFFNAMDEKTLELPKDASGLHFLDLNSISRDELVNSDIVCSCLTSQNNPLIIKSSIAY